MLNLILADTELETVPSKISSDKSIQRRARKRGRRGEELILDSNYHHRPMRKLQDNKRRGRPDIAHVCMLTALDSPLNHEGFLNFCVHTRHEKIIDIDPETRIPRSYNRFIGLVEQLFLTGGVPPDNPLMELKNMTLAEKVKEIGAEKVIAFSKKGKSSNKREMFGGIEKDGDICAIVGGFPHGNFLSNVAELSDEIIKIYEETLDAVTVLAHVIQFYEEEYLSLG